MVPETSGRSGVGTRSSDLLCVSLRVAPGPRVSDAAVRGVGAEE
jgi:hypothetical protein